MKNINKTQKAALIVILFYFIILWYGTMKENQYACVVAAFIALFASVLFGPIKYFDKDINVGIIVSFLISLGLGALVSNFYLDFNNFTAGIFAESNIGNTITTLSLTILLLEKFYTLLTKVRP